MQQIGRELGVRHVLRGSIQKAGDRVRITAQLADAVTGQQVWAEHYDRPFGDLFALQDDISFNILEAMQVSSPRVTRLASIENVPRIWTRTSRSPRGESMLIASTKKGM